MKQKIEELELRLSIMKEQLRLISKTLNETIREDWLKDHKSIKEVLKDE